MGSDESETQGITPATYNITTLFSALTLIFRHSLISYDTDISLTYLTR